LIFPFSSTPLLGGERNVLHLRAETKKRRQSGSLDVFADRFKGRRTGWHFDSSPLGRESLGPAKLSVVDLDKPYCISRKPTRVTLVSRDYVPLDAGKIISFDYDVNYNLCRGGKARNVK
jgi:hypothetical protein